MLWLGEADGEAAGEAAGETAGEATGAELSVPKMTEKEMHSKLENCHRLRDFIFFNLNIISESLYVS